jgi:3-isopropylmalate dehydrogenase
MAGSKSICILPGDGIGPEVIGAAVDLLRQVASLAGFEVDTREGAIGGNALDHFGTSLPDDTIRLCKSSDAILLGLSADLIGIPIPSTCDRKRAF